MAFNELQELLRDVDRANVELARALERGVTAEIEDAMARVTLAERRRNHLVHLSLTSSRSPYSSSLPVRDRVISALQAIDRPASTTLIADIAKARTGDPIDTRALASLRRDELRSWSLAHQVPPRVTPRPPYVVPALSYDRFTPMRGVLVLSELPAQFRFVTPSSPRVDLLHTVKCLIRLVREDRFVDEPGDIEMIISKLARTLPGSTAENRERFDWVVAAADAELRKIASRDADERAEAAERAARQLTPVEYLFGAGAGGIHGTARSIA